MRYFVRMTEDDTDFQVMEDVYNNARAVYWVNEGYTEINQTEYHELRREYDMTRQQDMREEDALTVLAQKVRKLFKR